MKQDYLFLDLKMGIVTVRDSSLLSNTDAPKDFRLRAGCLTATM